jgi:hypothetical protein
MSAVLQGRAEALVLLKIRAAAIGMEQACLDLIDCMAGCQISSDQEEYIVAAQIHRVSKETRNFSQMRYLLPAFALLHGLIRRI